MEQNCPIEVESFCAEADCTKVRGFIFNSEVNNRESYNPIEQITGEEAVI
jgi:hypothetical protein